MGVDVVFRVGILRTLGRLVSTRRPEVRLRLPSIASLEAVGGLCGGFPCATTRFLSRIWDLWAFLPSLNNEPNILLDEASSVVETDFHALLHDLAD